jgi:hypothetical protein
MANGENEPLSPSLDAEGIPDLEGPLPQKVQTGDEQEGLYPPGDDYVGADAHGVTESEQREGALLDERVAAERPDPVLDEITALADEPE